jgi:hypothetical protein
MLVKGILTTPNNLLSSHYLYPFEFVPNSRTIHSLEFAGYELKLVFNILAKRSAWQWWIDHHIRVLLNAKNSEVKFEFGLENRNNAKKMVIVIQKDDDKELNSTS